MGKIVSTINLDMGKQQLLNSCLQNLTVHPTNPSLAQIYFNVPDKTVYCWTGDVPSGGAGWLDLGYLNGSYVAINETFQNNEVLASFSTDTSGNVTNIAKRLLLPSDLGIEAGANNYIHPNFTPFDSGAMTGFTVIERLQTNSQGHVTNVTTRNINITPASINAAEANHTHTLASGATDVTATSSEINASSDLSGVTGAIAGWTYRFVSPTVASWGKLKGSEIENDMLWVQINDFAPTDYTTYSGDKIESIISTLQNNLQQDLVGAMVFQGGLISTSVLPTPTSGTTIKKGYTWIASGFTGQVVFVGHTIENGDILVASVNNPTLSNASHWIPINKNIPSIITATTVTEGLVRLATLSEVNNGTGQGVVTAQSLHQRQATQAMTGLVQFATSSEAIAGTSQNKAISPYTMVDYVSANTSSYSTNFGDGTATEFTIIHNLNSNVITVQVFDNNTEDMILCQIRRLSTNQIKIMMNIAPTANQYRVNITR